MLNSIIKLAVAVMLAVVVTGCAATATELDFGNSTRANTAAATLHPEGQPAEPEVGDGKRLEHVVTGYQETSTPRSEVGTNVRLGIGGRSQ